MKKLLLLYLCFIVSLSSFTSTARAQRLNGNVTVKMDRLPQEHQNLLTGLDRIIEGYLNNNEWCTDEYNYDFYLDFEIVFQEAKAISFENRYSAMIVVSNRKDAQFSDKRWEFPLEPGVQLIYSIQFDPFRSFLDYYIYMVLGYEFDKLKKFGGNQYFDTASQICQNARFSSRFFLGWDKREELLEDYLEEKNNNFRYLNFLYYTGEWLYYTERDRKEAKGYLLYAAKQLDKIPEDRLERFFEINYYNYANALAEYEEIKVLNDIASKDPAHADLYEKLLK